MFLHPFPNAFGLDIGDASIKLVQLQNIALHGRNRHYRVSLSRSVDLPQGIIVNGELQKPEEARKKMQELLAGRRGEKKIRGRWVVASLPETKSFITLLHTPIAPDALTAEEIYALARHHIPFEENDYYLDWQIIPPGAVPNRAETALIVGAAPKSIADSYTYLLESMGLGVIALEIEALPLARTMITAGKDYTGEARGILDLGATRGSFIICNHSLIQLSISCAFSGEGLTAALAQKLNISREDAEKMKREQGVSYEKGEAWKVCAEFTDALGLDIQKAIEFYRSHFPETNPITRIVMCGGGAYLKHLDQLLTEKLQIETRPGDPWKNGIRTPAHRDVENPLSFATAIGLALRAVDNPFLSSRSTL